MTPPQIVFENEDEISGEFASVFFISAVQALKRLEHFKKEVKEIHLVGRGGDMRDQFSVSLTITIHNDLNPVKFYKGFSYHPGKHKDEQEELTRQIISSVLDVLEDIMRRQIRQINTNKKDIDVLKKKHEL